MGPVRRRGKHDTVRRHLFYILEDIGMKSKFEIILFVFIIGISFLSCDKDDGNIIHGENFQIAIKRGLSSEDLSEEELLYVEDIENDKIIFFTRDRALGIATVVLKDNKWYWQRIGALIDYQTDISYASSGKKIEALSGNEYYIVMGKIFNDKIKSIKLNNNSINAHIRKHDNDIFWFTVLKNTEKYSKITAYSEDGEVINH